MSRLDQWAWRAIHAQELKKSPQPEATQEHPQESPKKILP
jgi:hypothetical protein